MEGEEVEKLINESGISKKDFAGLMGVHQNTITKWAKEGISDKITQSGVLSILKDFKNEPDQVEIYKVDTSGKEIINHTKYKPSEDLIPFWDIDFIAGNSFDTIDEKSSRPDYYMDIPDFRGCTAFRAYSDSMEGLIKSGSILFGTKVQGWEEHLEFGQIYGIVCQDGRKYLKYIKKFRDNPSDYFLLESENKFYDEFEIPKRVIRSVWLIHGHLSKRI